jgi:molybdenum cofactor biosynthesis enzyme MoaA
VGPAEITEWTQQLNSLQLRIDEIMPFQYGKEEREKMLQIRRCGRSCHAAAASLLL